MTDYTLKQGDTIRCHTKIEVLRIMAALKQEGYEVTSSNKVITILGNQLPKTKSVG